MIVDEMIGVQHSSPVEPFPFAECPVEVALVTGTARERCGQAQEHFVGNGVPGVGGFLVLP